MSTLDGLPGRTLSPWLDLEEPPARPAMAGSERVDVAVIGAGIVGLATAYAVAERGASVALIEARRLGHGVTGNTTAKLSSLHGLTYGTMRSQHGGEVAAAYAAANEAGIATVSRLVDAHSIDCDFRRKPNFTYAESAGDRDRIETEVEAASQAGLRVSFTEETDLPWGVAAAIRCEEQAEFHPHRFLLALAAELESRGVRIFEHSRATGVNGTTVATDGGRIEAEHVVLATHMPFLDRAGYFARVHPERSYALGLRLAGAAPQGMYISTEQPSHTIRSHPLGDGELVIVGGESHKTGQSDAAERYRSLERYARERFEVESVEYRWAAQDNMPADGLPMIGKLWPFSDRLWCATGMRKWGLAMGVSAGEILADSIDGRAHPWAEVFDPNRLNPRASAKDLVQENANVGARFVVDRLTKRASRDQIEPGEGAVVADGLRQLAVYRDESGGLHELSARCSHLGCIVNWNGGDKSWDCPCHGSRFGPQGDVIHGPAVRPLPPADD